MEIKLAQINQVKEIFAILSNCKTRLEEQGIYQWVTNYPNMSTVENDIKNEHLYCAIIENRCGGTICINQKQEPEYASVSWNGNTDKALVIHRLAVAPDYQGQGIAKEIMKFAERYGIDNNFSTIRLDAFSANKHSLSFYENIGYQKRGEVYFPDRELPFFCYEKVL